jgi:hypothetical protein
MAHYAFLDNNNTVIEVIVGKDEDEGTINWEKHYGDFRGKRCLRTSYNTQGGQHIHGGTPFRKNYAGIGYTYDDQRDAFIPPKPYESWQLDEDSCLWSAPTAMPDDGKRYTWNEDSLSWTEVNGS